MTRRGCTIAETAERLGINLSDSQIAEIKEAVLLELEVTGIMLGEPNLYWADPEPKIQRHLEARKIWGEDKLDGPYARWWKLVFGIYAQMSVTKEGAISRARSHARIEGIEIPPEYKERPKFLRRR